MCTQSKSSAWSGPVLTSAYLLLYRDFFLHPGTYFNLSILSSAPVQPRSLPSNSLLQSVVVPGLEVGWNRPVRHPGTVFCADYQHLFFYHFKHCPELQGVAGNALCLKDTVGSALCGKCSLHFVKRLLEMRVWKWLFPEISRLAFG